MPLVKWAGGKTAVLSQLLQHFPADYHTYYEPFLGGAAVLLHLVSTHPDRHHIGGDTNQGLINLYQQAQTRRATIAYLADLYFGAHSPDAYQYLRRVYNGDRTTPEAAALFLYLNRAGFNGVYRENRKGEFNISIGSNPHPQLPEGCLDTFVTAARDVVFLHGDYRQVCASAAAGDFVYFDPPYHQTFTGYQAGGFDEAAQARLADFARELWSRGVLVAVSNSNTKFMCDLYRMWNSYEVLAPRAIRNGPPVIEKLWTSY